MTLWSVEKIGLVAGRELRAYFLSPIAYVAMTAFLLYNGIAVAIILRAWMDMPGIQGSPLSGIFGGTFFYWLFLIMLAPVITMRLFAEERRSGTLETLMTAPLGDVEVVLGKFLAALGFYAVLWVPTLVYVWVLRASVEAGPVLSSYLGTMLIGAVFVSAGLLTSALTRNQIVAAILSFLFVAGFFVLGIGELIVQDPALKAVLGVVNLWTHMEEFSRGIVDSRRLVLYGSVIAFLLFATVRTVAAKKGT